MGKKKKEKAWVMLELDTGIKATPTRLALLKLLSKPMSGTRGPEGADR